MPRGVRRFREDVYPCLFCGFVFLFVSVLVMKLWYGYIIGYLRSFRVNRSVDGGSCIHRISIGICTNVNSSNSLHYTISRIRRNPLHAPISANSDAEPFSQKSRGLVRRHIRRCPPRCRRAVSPLITDKVNQSHIHDRCLARHERIHRMGVLCIPPSLLRISQQLRSLHLAQFNCLHIFIILQCSRRGSRGRPTPSHPPFLQIVVLSLFLPLGRSLNRRTRSNLHRLYPLNDQPQHDQIQKQNETIQEKKSSERNGRFLSNKVNQDPAMQVTARRFASFGSSE